MKTLALSRKWTAVAVVLAGLTATSAALLTGGCHHDGSNGPSGTTETREPTFVRELATNGATLGGRAKAPGLLHVYSLKVEQDLGFIAKKDDKYRPDQSSIKLAIRGELRMAFVGAEGDGHRVYAELSALTIDLGNDADTRAIAGEMMRPFMVSADVDGRVRGYAFERNVSTMAQNMIRSIVGQAQLVAKREARFEATEDDIHGTYVARYERSGAGQITKTKVRYEKIVTNDALVQPDQSARIEHGGQTIAKIDDDGWPVSLTSDEKKIATMGDDMPTASTHLRLEMKLLSTKTDTSLLDYFDRTSLVRVGPFGAVDRAAARRASDEKLAGDRTIDDMLATARRLQGEQARGVLAEQMAARFRLTPDAIEAAANAANKLRVDDAKLLTSALASASTPEATRALGGIANDKRIDADVRAQAATQLAFSGQNAADAKDALVQAMGDGSRDVRTSAALALGSVVRELGGDDTVTNELAQSYREAASDDERMAFLHALGNTGSVDVLPVAREALRSSNESLRDAAAQALRFLPLGEADTLLDGIILGDAAEDVRTAAVEAIGFRIAERHAGVFERVLLTDPSNKVKGEVVTVVTKQLATRGATLSTQGRAVLQALLAKARQQ